VSEIVDRALEYRNELQDLTASINWTMTADWAELYRKLDNRVAELDDAFKKANIQNAEDALRWANATNRYAILRDQVYDLCQSYVPKAQARIEIWQRQGALSGVRSVQDMLSTVTRGGLPLQFNRLPQDALMTLLGALRKDTPLKALLDQIAPDAAKNAVRVLTKGLAMGESPRGVAKELRDALGVSLSRALTIARTETIRAERTAVHAQLLESKDVLNGWKRLANKRGACLACLLLDGTVHPVEEPLEDHPNGCCVAVPLVKGTKEPQWTTGKEHFQSLSPDQQIALMGQKTWDAWSAGHFQLDDMVRWSDPNAWGQMPFIRPYYDLMGLPPPGSKILQTTFFDLSAVQEKNIQDLLKSGVFKVVDWPAGATGYFPKDRIEFTDGTWAIMKPSYGQGWYTLGRGELTAYQLDKMLGMGYVPPTWRKVLDNQYVSKYNPGEVYKKGTDVSLQFWVKGSMPWSDAKRPKVPFENRTDFGNLFVMDFVSLNWDREARNMMYKDGHIVAIDNGVAFAGRTGRIDTIFDTSVRYYRSEYKVHPAKLPVSQGTKAKLQDFYDNDRHKELTELPDDEQNNVKIRVGLLLRDWDRYVEEVIP